MSIIMDNLQYISLFDGIVPSYPIEYKNLYIYQISEAVLASKAEIEEHTQFCDEISYIISGSAVISNNDKKQHFKAGDIHIIGKDDKHKIEVDSDKNLRYVCIGLKITAGSSYKLFENIFRDGAFTKLQAADEIRTLISLLINELYSKTLFHEDMIEMLTLQILTLIYRKAVLGTIPSAEAVTPPMTSVLHKILHYIDTSFMTLKNIDEIAQKLSYSKFYISHIFKEKTGMTVCEYIMRKKTEAAIAMLKEEQSSIADISERLGYESTQSFSKMFKRQTGITPAKFRNTAKNYTP